MRLSYFKEGVTLTKRDFLVLVLPYLSGSVWYYLFYTQMLKYAWARNSVLLDQVSVLFNFSIVLSLLMSSFFVDRINRIHVIYLWAALMPILMSLLTFFTDSYSVSVLTAILGGIFSVAIVSYSTYFRSATSPAERGRVSGMITCLSLLVAPIFVLLLRVSASPWDLIIYFFLGVSTLVIYPLRRNGKTTSEGRKGSSAIQSIDKYLFLLYFVPWTISCYANGLSSVITGMHLSPRFAEIEVIGVILKYLAAAVGSLSGGLIADWLGRKPSILAGIILYGLGAAFNGLSSITYEKAFFLISNIMGGLNWGIFLAIYILVVWGDLAPSRSCAPLYAAGLIPFYLFQGLGRLVLPPVSPILALIVFFVESLLLFSSIVFILRAPEIRSKEEVERMKLRMWIQRAKKIYERSQRSQSRQT